MTTVAPEFEILARTETEVAADTVWALLEAVLLSRKYEDLRAALSATHLSTDDLRLASIRWDRRKRIPAPTAAHTRPERTLTTAERKCPELGMIPDPPAGPATNGAPTPNLAPVVPFERPKPRPAPIPEPTKHVGPQTLECRRCRKTKPLNAFPPPARIRRVCLDCGVLRIVDQARLHRDARLTVVLERDDPCVGMDCAAGCGHALTEGDVMVVQSMPRHEQCPQ